MTDNAFIRYLPAVYQEDAFLANYLAAFEKILFGRDDSIEFEHPGLEEEIENIATLFDPFKTRKEFLEWLAGWTALILRADLPVDRQQGFISNIIQLYKNRGTKKNLQHLLEIFLGGTPTVEEPDVNEMQIGKSSIVGVDTYLGGGPPHLFRVILPLASPSPEFLKRQLETARALIELEKPAHTYYELDVSFPTMQIGAKSTIGIDTIIGTQA